MWILFCKVYFYTLKLIFCFIVSCFCERRFSTFKFGVTNLMAAIFLDWFADWLCGFQVRIVTLDTDSWFIPVKFVDQRIGSNVDCGDGWV